MARPVRLEFGGALYHVTALGDRREATYEDDVDRGQFLGVLGQMVGQLNWCCHASCLMSNHYYLVIATPDGNLSKGMRQLNGVFAQWSNRRHNRTVGRASNCAFDRTVTTDTIGGLNLGFTGQCGRIIIPWTN